MELCIDNPREGFADLFATHLSVDSRVQALVKYAGGRDPGPLALASANSGDLSRPPSEGELPPPVPSGLWSSPTEPADASRNALEGASQGPWGRCI
jgi:heat shock protein HtpX